VAHRRFSGASYLRLRRHRKRGLQWPVYTEDTPVLHLLDFRTDDGLGRFIYHGYKVALSHFRRKNFDPFRRRDRLSVVVDNVVVCAGQVSSRELAQPLKDAGLQRITISLDSLDEEVFKAMNGRGFTTEKVLEAIETASEVGLSPIKINCVVQKNVNDHTIVDLARHFKGTGHIVRYIEYMDVGNRNGWRSEHVVPADEIIAKIDAEMPLEPVASNYQGEVATRYRYKDGSGEIGFIASVTKPFCGDCTRVRLSTDGKIYTCLFAGEGISLRDPMRSGADDNELRDLITGIWTVRSDRYSEERAASPNGEGTPRKIEMYQIGG